MTQFSEINEVKSLIETGFNNLEEISTSTASAVKHTIEMLDRGEIRVATKDDASNWIVNEWVKKAVLLSFRLNNNQIVGGGPNNATWWDKIDPKTQNWTDKDFMNAGFRYVPGAIVRKGSFIDKNVILMPSFVNIGAYVGSGTMIDTWATVGSCAQIGSRVHISGGTGIGGVLEPLNARPVIIEDNVFIGARSEVAEGVIVREGSVISMGCFIGASTKIVNRMTGEITYSEIPPYSVVVPATLPATANNSGKPQPSLACVAIVKTVDAKTRSKTSINDLLRD